LPRTALIKPKQYYENIFMDRMGMFLHTPYALEEKLVRAVVRGKRKAAADVLGEIRKSGEKAVLAADPLRSAKNSLICLCTIITRAAIQAGVYPDEAFALSDAVIQHLEELHSRSQVLEYEESMTLQFIELVQGRREKRYSRLIERALQYIDTHLAGKILLEEIAASVHTHPAYLSSQFKREVKKSITEYATARKIQEAAYFVEYSEYSLGEIAALYGFSSPCYFNAVFKKVMGITPGAYRGQKA
jgi:YesN/AraC family two-component response regulator